MAALLPCRTTLVWLLLVGATLISWGMGRGETGDRAIASISVLVAAMIKASLILFQFMELRRAALIWRAIFIAWLVIVGGAMVILYLLPPAG